MENLSYNIQLKLESATHLVEKMPEESHRLIMESIDMLQNPWQKLELAIIGSEQSYGLDEQLMFESVIKMIDCIEECRTYNGTLLEAEQGNFGSYSEIFSQLNASVTQAFNKPASDLILDSAKFAGEVVVSFIPDPIEIAKTFTALAKAYYRVGINDDPTKAVEIIYNDFDLVEFANAIYLGLVVMQMMAPTGASQASALAMFSGRKLALKAFYKLASSQTKTLMTKLGLWNVAKISGKAMGATIKKMPDIASKLPYLNPRNYLGKWKPITNSVFKNNLVKNKNAGGVMDKFGNDFGVAWADNFDRAMKSGNFDLAQALLVTRNQLSSRAIIKTPNGFKLRLPFQDGFAKKMGINIQNGNLDIHDFNNYVKSMETTLANRGTGMLAMSLIKNTGVAYANIGGVGAVGTYAVRGLAESVDQVKMVWSCMIVALITLQTQIVKQLLVASYTTAKGVYEGDTVLKILTDLGQQLYGPASVFQKLLFGDNGEGIVDSKALIISQVAAEQEILNDMAKIQEQANKEANEIKSSGGNEPKPNQPSQSVSPKLVRDNRDFNNAIQDAQKAAGLAFD